MIYLCFVSQLRCCWFLHLLWCPVKKFIFKASRNTCSRWAAASTIHAFHLVLIIARSFSQILKPISLLLGTQFILTLFPLQLRAFNVGFATYHSLFFSETVETAHTYLDTAGLKVRFLVKSLCSYIFSLLIYFLPLSYFNCSKGV